MQYRGIDNNMATNTSYKDIYCIYSLPLKSARIKARLSHKIYPYSKNSFGTACHIPHLPAYPGTSMTINQNSTT